MIDPDHGPRAVELGRAGVVVTRRHGRLGGPMREQVQTFVDEVEADRALLRMVDRTRRHGYQLGAQCPELIAAIDADPDDVDGYLVYADWLCERRNPHGELIQLMVALWRAGGDQPDLQAAIQGHFARHRLHFVRPQWRELALGWRWGFIVSASPHDWPTRLRPGPGFAPCGPHWRDPLYGVFDHPCGRFVRHAARGDVDFELRFDADARPRELLRRPRPQGWGLARRGVRLIDAALAAVGR